MNKEQHEYELAASHARAQAEERDEHPRDRRLRLIREIAEGMKDIVKPQRFDQAPF